MKQMKRAAGLLLALVLVLSMAACGKKDGDGGDSQSGFQRGTIENGIYTNVKVEQTPVQFAGLVREGAVISGEMDGVPMYETLVCIKQEGYMCCVTMCSWTEDITADLVELFYQA